MYKELYPDETDDLTPDDIDIQTIKSVIVNTQYNDLGFTVKDKCIILVEAQSTWNLNMLVRILFYLTETLKRYIKQTDQSEHQSSRLQIPVPELYVFYSGKEERPSEISLNEEFFGGKSSVDLRVKIINKVDKTLAGQYIGFCRVFDEQRKLYDDPIMIAKETYRICVENDYLTIFMKAHEAEVITMMSELFDEEYMREQYNHAEKVKNLKIGRAEGLAEGLAKGEAKKEHEIIEKLRQKGMTEEEIKSILS